MIEVMVSAGILAFGVLSLVNLFGETSQGVRDRRLQMAAAHIAVQRVERMAIQPVERLPACEGAPGCRQNWSALAAPDAPAPDGFACTDLVEGMTLDEGAGGAVDGPFRVDTRVVDHPDGRQQVGARVLTVSVCWTDSSGRVLELEAERMLLPEM